jgi:DNA replication protein DnaC
MSMKEIEHALRSLRLSGIRSTLEARSLQANQGEITFLEAFSFLLQDELERRRAKTIERRFNQSGLKERKTLSGFDWGFNPKLPKKACLELLALKFIIKGENVIIIGHPGTGKSHIAQTLAHAAIESDYRVIYREAHQSFTELYESQQFRTRKKVMNAFSDTDLLVIDDLFLRKRLPDHAADDLQEIIMNRYSQKKSTLITSNRITEDWGKCLGDVAVASAILDRLIHHGHMLRFNGKSYRLKEAAEKLAKQIKES